MHCKFLIKNLPIICGDSIFFIIFKIFTFKKNIYKNAKLPVTAELITITINDQEIVSFVFFFFFFIYATPIQNDDKGCF